MALFTGTYPENRIDRKGRVSLPAKFRGELPPENNREIYIYPSPTFMALEGCDRSFMERLRDTASINPYTETEEDIGLLLEEAINVTVDTGGRFIMPTDLAIRVGIEDQVVFVGRGNQFLMMSPEAHRKRREQTQERLNRRTQGGAQ